MLTLVVRGGRDAAPLVETLTPLVDGVVKGLVGRLFIVAEGKATADVERVAQEAGAAVLVAERWTQGLAEAARLSKALPGRRSHAVVADAGVVVDDLFWPAVERFMRQTGSGDASQDIIAATRVRGGALATLVSRMRGNRRLTREQVAVMPIARLGEGVWDVGHGARVLSLQSASRRLER